MAETKSKSTTAKKPAPAKPAAPKKTAAAKKPATPRKSSTKKTAPSPAAAPKMVLSPQERYTWIQTRAYYIAEADGFRGDPKEYWAQAEMHIDSLLTQQ
jgi:hypothetical protein